MERGRRGERRGPCPESQCQKKLAWLLGTPSLPCSWWLHVTLTLSWEEPQARVKKAPLLCGLLHPSFPFYPLPG